MWILVADAYISLQAIDGEPQNLRVRARKITHIRALFGDVEVWCFNSAQQGYETHADDYRFQASVAREEVKRVLLARIDQITTHSFRDDISDPLFFDACARARKHLHAIQPASIFDFLNGPDWQ